MENTSSRWHASELPKQARWRRRRILQLLKQSRASCWRTSELPKQRRAVVRLARTSSRADGCSRKRVWCSSASCASGQRLCARAGRGTLRAGNGMSLTRADEDRVCSSAVSEVSH